jgi:hypothetical protein
MKTDAVFTRPIALKRRSDRLLCARVDTRTG